MSGRPPGALAAGVFEVTAGSRWLHRDGRLGVEVLEVSAGTGNPKQCRIVYRVTAPPCDGCGAFNMPLRSFLRRFTVAGEDKAVPDWNKVIKRIGNGEPVEDVVDEALAKDREEFRHYIGHTLGRPDLLAEYDANIRKVDLGITSAEGTWHALSAPQRRTLEILATGRALVRCRTSPTFYDAVGAPEAISKAARVLTVRNLADRELVAWEGGALDPEGRASITERGRFVLQHGRPA